MGSRETTRDIGQLMHQRPTLYFCGNSKGSIGPGGSGSCLCDADGRTLWEGFFYLEESTTSNTAHYDGLIQGLEAAAQSGIKQLRVCSHAQLVIEQMKGSWKVKTDRLVPLYNRAQQLLDLFDDVVFENISKEENLADGLSSQAMREYRTHSTWAHASVTQPMEETNQRPRENRTYVQKEPSNTLYFDGGARGNPGPGGSGACLYDVAGRIVWEGYFYQGHTTNNIAEYDGMIQGMRAALAANIKSLRIRGDSKLVIEQMKGSWKVKSPNLQQYHQNAQQLLAHFDNVIFEHIPREDNSVADSLANIAMDSCSTHTSWR